MSAMSEVINAGPAEPAGRRVLTTLLCTDVVDSTASAATVGGGRWGIELDHHIDMVRRCIERFGGAEVVTPGDGVIAMFDGPTRAVRCALGIRDEAAQHHVTVRAGVHTGEVELRGGDVLGRSVHVAQRLRGLAAGAQVMVTQRVVDLVAGSGLRFAHLGDHQLRGLPGRWSMFEASLPSRQPRGVDAGTSGTARPIVDGYLDDLSPREREVLLALATGASNAEIAARLFMSAATVKAHVSHLFVKLGCTNRVQLAILAHDAGLAGR
jgi:class 3 adenylate cyclase/DNA-binding CsgD family transcriptional regulator